MGLLSINPLTGWVAGGTLVAFVGLFGIMKAGEMARTKERDTAISERDKSDDKGDVICGHARSSFRMYDKNTGKLRPRAEWGIECSRFVLAMRDRVDGESQRTAEAIIADRKEQDVKRATYLVAYKRDLARQTKSQAKLESENAKIEGGHYPASWWAAWGDRLGLRSQAAEGGPTSAAGPGGSGPEGDTTAGTSALLRGPQ